MDKTKQAILREFQIIPGVGKSIAQDFYDLGFRSVQEIKCQDPEELYRRFCELVGMKVDRCMLYVFRCAVYFAENETHESEKLKWWNWQD